MSSKKLSFSDPVTQIPRVGPSFAQKLNRLGIQTISDLLHHYPARFLNYSQITPINQLKEKKDTCIRAVITNPKRFFTKTGKLLTQAIATDHSGQITLTWFNSPYIARLIKEDAEYYIAGKPVFYQNKLCLISPILELASNERLNTAGLVPIYPQTEGVTSRYLRQIIDKALQSTEIKDPLTPPPSLPDLSTAIKNIHFPESTDLRKIADQRLSFNEHLIINLHNLLEQKDLPKTKPMTIDSKQHLKLEKQLPFELTPSQQKAITQCYHDLTSSDFTHRLIQGETGSGKTMIMIFLSLQCLNNKSSFCLLAPTQVLAQQHYETFNKFLKNKFPIQLITSQNRLEATKKPTIYVGTHALLNQLPDKLDLGVVCVDEQHRFGVTQREKLLQRNPLPHLFNFSATPIPRTLALGFFGDIKITTLKHKPKNRLPPKTWVLTPDRFKNSKQWLEQIIDNQGKVFVVCPFIFDNDSKQTVASVTKLFQDYSRLYSQKTKVYLLHGQLKPAEIEQTLADFKNAPSGILVSTSIIEVGIDIPQAEVIIIHSAEYFGLAQLHQLRGRVGRGEGASYCLLVVSKSEEVETERLELLTKYHSGLILAKKDLKLRGSGQLEGVRQHGRLGVRLNHFWNRTLYQKAKLIAKQIIDSNPTKALEIAQSLKS